MDRHAIEDRGSSSAPDLLSPRRRAGAGTKARLFKALETAFDIHRKELCAANRGRCKTALARQTGMYLARVALGMTLSKAGHLFRRDRTTASHACRLVEDWRDDPGFDALVNAMERFVLQADPFSGSRRR